MDPRMLLTATMQSLGHRLSQRHADLVAEGKRLRSQGDDNMGKAKRLQVRVYYWV